MTEPETTKEPGTSVYWGDVVIQHHQSRTPEPWNHENYK